MLNSTQRQNQERSSSFNDLNSRKNRFVSFANQNNSLNQTVRLPQLSRSSSSSKSTQLKLNTIETFLCTFEQQLHTLKSDTRQSRRFTNFLKDELGGSQLGMLKLNLSTEINKFEKTFKLARKHNEDRTQNIKADCDILRTGSKKLKNLMNLLQGRINQCQSLMGVYTGKQRHKI